MKITTSFELGNANYQMVVEEDDEMNTLHKAIVLSNPRRKCNECGELGYESKYFTSNKDKEGNVYVNVKCGKCGARSKLGQYKAKGYFWRDYEKYDPDKQGEKIANEVDKGMKAS